MQPKVLTITEKDLLPILTMQYQERLREGTPSFLLTQKAQSLAGDQTDELSLLRVRAQLWHLAHPRSPIHFTPLRTFGYILCFLAFCFGLGLDALSNTQQTINLLAPPILLFLLWQCISYLLLLFRPWRWFSTSNHNPLFFRIWEKLHQKITTPSSYATLALQIEKIRRPVTLYEWQRFWHLASIFLALGLIFSIAWQGIGTEFTIGWTSTWFRAYPNRIGQLLATLYTHGPLTFWQGRIPNAQDLALLNLHRNPAGSPHAAYWLYRFMRLIALWVLIPRSILAIWSHLKVKQAKNNLLLPIQTPYFQAIFKNSTTLAQELTIFYTPGRETITTQLIALQNLCISHALFSHITLQHIDFWRWESLPRLSFAAQNGRIAFVMPAQSTPEAEVHARLLRAALQAYPQAKIEVWVLLDELLRRFATQETRIQSRKALWEKFLLRLHIDPLWLTMKTSEDQENFIRKNFLQSKSVN